MKSKIEKLIVSSGILALALPVITFAGPAPDSTSGTFQYEGSVFKKIITLVQDIFSAIFPVVTAGLVLWFAYEVYKFMSTEDDKKSVYKSNMIKSLVALFIWFTFFGIIQVVAGSFGLGLGDKIDGSSDVSSIKFD